MELAVEWGELLRRDGAGYARLALASIRREFPSAVRHTMAAPGDFPYRPRARTPVFYGSHDWHSCVGMHWALLRLLRVAAPAVPAAEIRAVLDARFSPVALAAETEFVAGRDSLLERPHGWGWALMLAHEAASWADPYGVRWAAALAPLADTVTMRFLEWLAQATYPVRCGGHGNSAFGLSLALPHARLRAGAGEGALLTAITAKAYDWFGADILYPAGWEPSGQDVLSPALAEAELMAQVMPDAEFSAWLSVFLPGIASTEPPELFTPATVSDSADPGIARLHGLNASRAWCWRRIAEALPGGDPRTGPAVAAARAHAAAVLPPEAGGKQLVADWLACYAVLLLS